MFKLPTAKEFAEKLNQMSDDEFDMIYRKLIDKCENNGHNWKFWKSNVFIEFERHRAYN